MARFMFFRVIQAIATLIVLSAAVFFGTDLTGDAALAMAPGDARPEEIQQIRENLGLDRPVIVRYVDYLGGILIGDFGRSYNKRLPVAGLVLERVPNTVQLAVAALFIAVVIGIPLGILSAVRRDTILDKLGKSFAILGMSMPQFWLAIILMWIFAVELNLLPVFGKEGLDPRYFVIPAFSIAVFTMAGFMRLTRSAMLEVLDSEYVKFARIKGLAEQLVIFKHALKNAVIPVLTFGGISFAGLLNGSIVVEVIFNWPGLGLLMLEGIRTRDVPIIEATILVSGFLYIIMSTLVDIAYAYVDPRIRYG
ncbi:MAG: ABC transporter permease [Chloroflexi bacterium]|nr:ABC transporter permease [Chloroflexota bacterium]MYD48587.1 ABC transporter permease [Chloroflexota bacterium]